MFLKNNSHFVHCLQSVTFEVCHFGINLRLDIYVGIDKWISKYCGATIWHPVYCRHPQAARFLLYTVLFTLSVLDSAEVRNES